MLASERGPNLRRSAGLQSLRGHARDDAVSGTPEPSAAPGVDLLMAGTAKRSGWFMIWEPEV